MINKHVSLASTEYSRNRHEGKAVKFSKMGAGRHGTIYMSLEQFADKLGNPHESVQRSQWRKYETSGLLDGAGKVSALWIFETPRGSIEVSDYWWNKSDQLSVRGTAATHKNAFLWFRKWARGHNIPIEYPS